MKIRSIEKVILNLVLIVIMSAAASNATGKPAGSFKMNDTDSRTDETSEGILFLPVVLYNREGVAVMSRPRINLPYFDVEDMTDKFSELAIAWFGMVNPIDNYADIRVGYNDEALYIYLNIIDRIQWYDINPSPYDLTNWDAVTLFLDLDSTLKENPDQKSYQLVAALSHYQPREEYQASYRGNGMTWEPAALPFSSTAYYRGGGGLNNDQENRGWTINFKIPFTSLGMSNPPSTGKLWKLGVVLHDRDDALGTTIENQTWPDGVLEYSPPSWGELHFGLARFSPPLINPAGTVIIRNKLNGIIVPDAAVGGTTGNLCPGDSYHIWNEWGFANYAFGSDFSIQNQGDIADWPCFAKYYVTFPLSSLPQGKEIISAKLTIYEFGNAGDIYDSDPENRPRPSLIQVLTVANEWYETTLSWNNAPLALENVSQTWVYPLIEFPGWPGEESEWDVSYAAAQAYTTGKPLQLVLYEADLAQHSGKYFLSSDEEDWNEIGRPTLSVTWGEP